MKIEKLLIVTATLALTASVVFLAACGGGSSSTTSTGPAMGTVSTTLSDPPTCSSSTGGAYSHIYVTVTDVKVHQSATASSTDAGWVDLAPGMAPRQIDLLGAASSQCFLANLGAQQILAGSYQQIRIILLANNMASQLSGNQCGAGAANCVVLADSSVHTLQLSSEAQTGIKIPSGQLAGGRFTVPAGGTVDLNIDFDGCASIVAQPNGQFRLRPVLHAGEVSLNTTSISGKLVDSVTLQPIVGGTAIVALEQKDVTGVDRVILQTKADASGNFTFCPVPLGTYDVVAVAVNGAGVGYAATVTTGVVQGTAMGNVPLIAETGTNTTQGAITGQVTSAGASGGTVADITLSALQPITGGTLVTIPLVQQGSATVNTTTAVDVSCPAGTDCVSYTLMVPAANPSVGAFSSGGTTYTQDIVNPVKFTVDAQAFVPLSGGTADCAPSELLVNTLSGGGDLVVTAGGTATATTAAFTGCQ
jgi:hypothetical protein